MRRIKFLLNLSSFIFLLPCFDCRMKLESTGEIEKNTEAGLLGDLKDWIDDIIKGKDTKISS